MPVNRKAIATRELTMTATTQNFAFDPTTTHINNIHEGGLLGERKDRLSGHRGRRDSAKPDSVFAKPLRNTKATRLRVCARPTRKNHVSAHIRSHAGAFTLRNIWGSYARTRLHSWAHACGNTCQLTLRFARNRLRARGFLHSLFSHVASRLRSFPSPQAKRHRKPHRNTPCVML